MAGTGLDTCYWARLSGVSGEFDELIANDNAEGQFFVEVKSSDYAFKNDCKVTLLISPLETIECFPPN